MERSKLYPLILLSLVICLQACERQLQKRVMFSIDAIMPDQDVVAQGESINISATFSIVGTTNESAPDVLWESDLGTFESENLVSTIWTAPENYTGNLKIKLTATFMGHTDISERLIRVVKTPAAGWGSLSGYLFSENGNPLVNVVVLSGTGEGDTTDINGFFYILALPQGSNGLKFSNIPYSWATETPSEIEIVSGNHQHMGNIIIYTSTPAILSGYRSLPDHRAVLMIEHKKPELIKYHELYRAEDINGTGAALIRTIEPDLTEIQIQEEGNDAFYAFKSVPLNGDKSPYSAWTYITFLNAVDPDADGSYFSYDNFFSANLYWQLTGYESYYKGFRVMKEVGDSMDWVSPMLGTGTSNYQISTVPGETGTYYVLAISENGLYNSTQPEEQKIILEVPTLEPPRNFRGKVLTGYDIRLLWEPVANNDTWYSGYFIEKKIVTDTSTVDWEELIRIPVSLTGEYTDEEADSGNTYHYRISSVAFPTEPGNIYYSPLDSINVSTK